MNIALFFDTTTIVCGAAVIILAVLSSFMNPFFRFLPSHDEEEEPERIATTQTLKQTLLQETKNPLSLRRTRKKRLTNLQTPMIQNNLLSLN